MTVDRDTELRKCKKCEKTKPLDEFPKADSTGKWYKRTCKECDKKRYVARREALGKDGRKNEKLKHNYNISLDDFNTMRENQNYRCAIC